MNVNKARKILGKLSNGVTDSELEQEIKTAELMKILYFNQLRKKQVENENKKK